MRNYFQDDDRLEAEHICADLDAPHPACRQRECVAELAEIAAQADADALAGYGETALDADAQFLADEYLIWAVPA